MHETLNRETVNLRRWPQGGKSEPHIFKMERRLLI